MDLKEKVFFFFFGFKIIGHKVLEILVYLKYRNILNII